MSLINFVQELTTLISTSSVTCGSAFDKKYERILAQLCGVFFTLHTYAWSLRWLIQRPISQRKIASHSRKSKGTKKQMKMQKFWR